MAKSRKNKQKQQTSVRDPKALRIYMERVEKKIRPSMKLWYDEQSRKEKAEATEHAANILRLKQEALRAARPNDFRQEGDF